MPKTPFQTAGHFSTFSHASSALILAMKFDNFITLFYLMVTNPLVHLNALWYPTILYTKLHNGSDPPCTQKYLMVIEGLRTKKELHMYVLYTYMKAWWRHHCRDIAGHERFGHMTRVYYKYAYEYLLNCLHKTYWSDEACNILALYHWWHGQRDDVTKAFYEQANSFICRIAAIVVFDVSKWVSNAWNVYDELQYTLSRRWVFNVMSTAVAMMCVALCIATSYNDGTRVI